MADELKTIKFQMMLSPSEAERIDDWGFERRIRSRAEAIRRLCEAGFLLDEIAPKILKALEKLEDFRDGPEDQRDFADYEEGMRALYEVLGPAIIGRIGVRSMSDMQIEVSSSAAVAALYAATTDSKS